MKDRIPKYPGRVKLNPVPGQANTFDLVRADEPTEPGTPLNKASLLSDSTATALGLGANATPDEAFRNIADKLTWGEEAFVHGTPPPVGTVVSYYNGNANVVAPAGLIPEFTGYFGNETERECSIEEVDANTYLYCNSKAIKLIKIEGYRATVLSTIPAKHKILNAIIKISSNKFAYMEQAGQNSSSVNFMVFIINNNVLEVLKSSLVNYVYTDYRLPSVTLFDNNKLLFFYKSSAIVYYIYQINSDNSLSVLNNGVTDNYGAMVGGVGIALTPNIIISTQVTSSAYQNMCISKIDSKYNLTYTLVSLPGTNSSDPEIKMCPVNSNQILVSTRNYITLFSINLDGTYLQLSTLSSTDGATGIIKMISPSYFVYVGGISTTYVRIGKISSNLLSWAGAAYINSNLCSLLITKMVQILSNNSFRVIGGVGAFNPITHLQEERFNDFYISASYDISLPMNSSYDVVAGVVTAVLPSSKVIVKQTGLVYGMSGLSSRTKYFLSDASGQLTTKIKVTSYLTSETMYKNATLVGMALNETTLLLRIGGV